MVPPSSDYKYPQAWDCASPSDGRFTQDRDHLPITLHPGCYPSTRVIPPTYRIPSTPSSQLRLGVEDGRQPPLPTRASLLAGAGLTPPGNLRSGRLFVFLSGKTKPPVLFPTTMSQPRQRSEDLAEGPAGAERL